MNKFTLILTLLALLVMPGALAVSKCNLDFSRLGIHDYQWIETNYPTSSAEEMAYAACMKASELSLSKLCRQVCAKSWLDWSPGTGAYQMQIHSSAIGHSHDYSPPDCIGGEDFFAFGYNSDAHTRGGHCMYSTEPGRIDMYHSGMYQGCHDMGVGHFSCEDVDHYCGDAVCDDDEDSDNCAEDCLNCYTKDEIDDMVGDLQSQIDSIKQTQQEQGNLLEDLKDSFNKFVNKIMAYFQNMPFMMKKDFVCGSMKDEGVNQKTEMEISCKLIGSGTKEMCACKRI